MSERFRVNYYFVSGKFKERELVDSATVLVKNFFNYHASVNMRGEAGINFMFYRETQVLNSGYESKVDGFFSDLPDFHSKDLLLDYSWDSLMGFQCDIYKDGRITKTYKHKNSIDSVLVAN